MLRPHSMPHTEPSGDSTISTSIMGGGCSCVAKSLNSHGGRFDYETETLITSTLTGNGDAHSGFRDENGLISAYQCHGGSVGPMGVVRAGNGNESGGVPFIPVAFDTTQVTSPQNRSNPQPGDPCHTLNSKGHPPSVFQTRIARNGRGQPSEIAPALSSEGHGDSHPCVISRGVRRLTPREAERLQGFPDDYTAIKYKGKPAADGPRYCAIGNSMAVPVMKWIGERIKLVDAIK